MGTLALEPFAEGHSGKHGSQPQASMEPTGPQPTGGTRMLGQAVVSRTDPPSSR